MTTDQSPAELALDALGIPYRTVRHAPVSSLAEAAKLRGIHPRDLVKTLVVRRGDDDYVFVLVPGDRRFSWPKLRAVLGVQRLSMPDAATAQAATGYARGTITPFGSTTAWPVFADQTIRGRHISMGAGAPNTGISLAADDALVALNAEVADLSDPE